MSTHTLEHAITDAITRLGRGASSAERTAVRDGITSLFYAQGHVTVCQSSAIVHVAILASERTRAAMIARVQSSPR